MAPPSDILCRKCPAIYSGVDDCLILSIVNDICVSLFRLLKLLQLQNTAYRALGFI